MEDLKLLPSSVSVGTLPTVNKDEYPGLGDTWVQLRNVDTNGDEVVARIYGHGLKQAVERAEAFAACYNSRPTNSESGEVEKLRAALVFIRDRAKSSIAIHEHSGSFIAKAILSECERCLSTLQPQEDGEIGLLDPLTFGQSQCKECGELKLDSWNNHKRGCKTGYAEEQVRFQSPALGDDVKGMTCCENGRFGDGHECSKQSSDTSAKAGIGEGEAVEIMMNHVYRYAGDRGQLASDLRAAYCALQAKAMPVGDERDQLKAENVRLREALREVARTAARESMTWRRDEICE